MEGKVLNLILIPFLKNHGEALIREHAPAIAELAKAMLIQNAGQIVQLAVDALNSPKAAE